MDGIAFVRNQGGVIHAVPTVDLADHLGRPGMALASLEEWLAQEGIAVEVTPAEPVKVSAQKKPVAKAPTKKPKGGK